MFIRMAGSAFWLACAGTTSISAQTRAGNDDNDTIIVRGQVDVPADSTILDGVRLDTARRSSLGETLAHEPGVSSTYFGPTASRPVIRGLQGPRVATLVDGLGSLDASASAIDFAPAVNPLVAQKIEIVRGPASVLYGSSAIGGAVNVETGRIPSVRPEGGISARTSLDYGSAAREMAAAGAFDVALGHGFVAHLDGTAARTGDLRIGGHVLSRGLRDYAARTTDPDVREFIRYRGRLPNSQSHSNSYGGGLAYLGAGGSIGVSASRLEARYGIPNRYWTTLGVPDHEDEPPIVIIGPDGNPLPPDPIDPGMEVPFEPDEPVDAIKGRENLVIDMTQARYDLHAEISPASGILSRLSLRVGYGDYRHHEIRPDGTISASFANKTIDARIEAVQRRTGVLDGRVGAQVTTRRYDVSGTQALLPITNVAQYGVFSLQSLDFDSLRLTGAIRFGQDDLRIQQAFWRGNEPTHRRYDLYNASLGVHLTPTKGVRIGLDASHAERAPTAEELFASGLHAAIQVYEQGNSQLGKEEKNGIEASADVDLGKVRFSLSGYADRFSNFLYIARGQDMLNGLPVYMYQENRADRWGTEASADADLFRIGAGTVGIDMTADYVRIQVRGLGPAPFIPPLRVRGGVGWRTANAQVRAEVEHAAAQNRIPRLEQATDGYTLTNLSVDWRPFGERRDLSLRLSANNLFDVDARRAASVIKDYAPLPGRDIRIGATVAW